MSNTEIQTLFLHWGPGANASLERLWFKNTPGVDWWDQPISFIQPESGFEETVQAAAQRLVENTESGRKVSILAHSFGGQIAVELLRRYPERIAELRFLACGAKPARGFLNLARRCITELERRGCQAQADLLNNARLTAESRFSAETFWPLIQGIVAIPDFMEFYWHNPGARKMYSELLPAAVPMSMEAFGAVMGCQLARESSSLKAIAESADIPVTFILGKFDPLQCCDEEIREWQRLFPRAEYRVEECGHFPHFELPISVWARGIF